MATIYSGIPSQTRFPFSSSHTHYTSNDDAAAQIQMQQVRYSNSFGIKNVMGGLLPRPSSSSSSSSRRPLISGGHTFGLAMKLPQTGLYPSTEPFNHVFRLSSPRVRAQNVSTSLYMQSTMHKPYQTLPPPPPQQQQQPSDKLLVSPGVPTPVELSIYEIKQPTGFLHVTRGNQTVEFLDGVANMPQKR